MVEQIEEVSPESQSLPFAQLEGLVQREIHILLWRPNDAVAWSVAVNRRVARGAVRKCRRQRILRISRGIYPVPQPRFRISVARSVAATEPAAEGRGRRG